MEEKESDRKEFIFTESVRVFVLLMIVSGMMGSHTYNVRGGVFCNAQTANFVMMAVAFGRGNWLHGLYYFIPATAYVFGAFLSELLPGLVKRFGHMSWDACFIGIEMLVLFLVGFVPLTVPHQVVQVSINFIASMQYNTFRQAHAIPMATTFCTNHVRQFGISLAGAITKRDIKKLKRGFTHLIMISGFVFGAIIETVACGYFGAKSIWLALIPLGVIMFGIMKEQTEITEMGIRA